MNIFDLTGKTAIITGGARGIGRAITELFADAGANVMIGDLREDEARKAAEEISAKTGARVGATKCDVAILADAQTMTEATINAFGQIDILVNNAGWDRMTPFLKSTPEFWDKVIGINYKGVINTCYAVLPHMKERKSGCIVNVSSDSARVGSMGEAIYSGSKAAVVAFSKTIAREHARDNVRVNVVCPGIAETSLIDEMNKEEFASKVLGAIINVIPMKRFAKPEEIAPMILFFASDAARYITGQVVSVNGGLTMVG